MNATEISQKTNVRLNRIKVVSRIVRYVVLANLVFNICFCLLFFTEFNLSEISARSFFMVLMEVFTFFWFWELARLFRFYERGLIFAAETIRCIKVLGVICICGWLTIAALHFVPRSEISTQKPPSNVSITKVQTFNYRTGFLSFNFGTGIDFGFLFIGVSVVIAAWIMDEGRKIQEEQELTV